MTAPGWFPPPSPDRCPACDGPVEKHRCRSCGLRLVGQAASTLWWVDTELHRLSGQRSAVLTQLRRASDAQAVAPITPTPVAFAGPPLPPPPLGGVAARPPGGPEARQADLQNVLLGLGAFLLAVAAVVFATVTWSRLSAGLQGLVLAGFTAAAFGGAAALRRRGLKATAEAVGAVGVILALVDAHAVRISVAPDGRPLLFWAVATALLSAGAAALTRVVPLVATRVSAAVLVQLSLPLALIGLRVGPQPLALGLLVQAATLVLVLAMVLPGRNGTTEFLFGTGAAIAWFSGSVLALVALADADSSRVALPAMLVVAAAAVAVLGGWFWEVGRRALLGIGTALVLVAVAGVLDTVVAGDALILSLGAMSAAIITVGAQAVRRTEVDRSWVDGPLLVGAVGAVASLVPLVAPALQALVGPFPASTGWWSGDLGASGRATLSGPGGWDGSAVTGWYLVLAGAVALAASGWTGRSPTGSADGGRHRVGPWLASGWLAVALPLAPLLLDVTGAVAFAWLLGCTALAVGLLVAGPVRPVQAWVVAAAAGAAATGWALHGPWTTVVLIGTFVVAGAAITWRGRPERFALPIGALATTALAVVLVPVTQRALGASVEAAWFGLAVAAVVGSALGWVFDLVLPAVAPQPTLPPPPPTGVLAPLAAPPVLSRPVLLRRATDGVEATCGILAVIGLWGAAALGSPDQVSIALAIGALVTAAHGTRPNRRFLLPVSALGALVLIWQRLAIGDVTTVEAYTLPAATMLLAVGWWFRQRAESSWAWCAPGLVVAFGPTVAVALHDPGLTRSLVALAAAAAVVLIGARARLQAPVAIGAVVLITLGLRQLGPVVDQLPRWVLFATAGTILISVGATYERRRLGLARLGDHFKALR